MLMMFCTQDSIVALMTTYSLDIQETDMQFLARADILFFFMTCRLLCAG